MFLKAIELIFFSGGSTAAPVKQNKLSSGWNGSILQNVNLSYENYIPRIIL